MVTVLVFACYSYAPDAGPAPAGFDVFISEPGPVLRLLDGWAIVESAAGRLEAGTFGVLAGGAYALSSYHHNEN